jgi:hypothetical protein
MYLYLIYYVLFLLLIFASSVVLLSSSSSSFLSSSSSAFNLIQNGNAETGQLYPWKTNKKGWVIASQSFSSGSYSFAVNSGTVHHLEDKNCSSHYVLFQHLVLSSSERTYSFSFWARSLIIRENNPILIFSVNSVEKKDVVFFSFSFSLDSTSSVYQFYSTSFSLPKDHNNLFLCVSTCFPVEIDEISLFSLPSSSSSSITLTPPTSLSPFNSNSLSSTAFGDQLAGCDHSLTDSSQR